MSLVTANDPRKPKRKKAHLSEEICLGCGLCVRECPDGAITMKERLQRVIPPLNAVHQAVVMAIERGKLQNLIFDNHALMSHRFMAAILGAILKLPPVKQLMASKQVKSRYLEALLRRAGMSAGYNNPNSNRSKRGKRQ
jgi:ferredoxin